MAMSTTSTGTASVRQVHSYAPPSWIEDKLVNHPIHGRLKLANLPTPLHKVESSNKHDGVLSRLHQLNSTLWIKRDDMTGGVELGGNKIRKLEFLLADALAKNCDAVLTIGGEQSNHCRATAAAARMTTTLTPHLILRTRRTTTASTNNDFGFTGNILFDRIVASHIYTCTPGEYGRIGSNQLLERLANHLTETQQASNPYQIPVGGSNGLGTWGYINGVEELVQQWNQIENVSNDPPSKLDHVVFACGSGGTAAGIALGLHFSPLRQEHQVHAVGVCDDPDYFYNHVGQIARSMGMAGLSTDDDNPEHDVHQQMKHIMTVHQGKGRGYAMSTQEELEFVTQFAIETGIVLDPVYSGKALYHFLHHVIEENQADFQGKNILFWHTGGSLGLYDKGEDLPLNDVSPVKRLEVYGTPSSGEMSGVVPI